MLYMSRVSGTRRGNGLARLIPTQLLDALQNRVFGRVYVGSVEPSGDNDRLAKGQQSDVP